MPVMLDKEAIADYKATLSDLTFSSRPLIEALTMLAEENISLAPQITSLIENRIQEAPKEQILPALYLLDSIIKSITSSRIYLNLFAENIADVFASAFERVEDKVRINLFNLRKTWSGLFQASVLKDLDMLTKFIDPGWPIFAELAPVASLKDDPVLLSNQQVKSQKALKPQPRNIASDSMPGPSNTDINVDIADPNPGLILSDKHVDINVKVNIASKKDIQDIKKTRTDESAANLQKMKKEQEKLRAKMTSPIKGDLLGRILTSGAASGVLKLDEEEEAQMRRQVIAKKQELLSIEQQRLRLQLEKARRQVEMQKKRIKKQAAAAAADMDSAHIKIHLKNKKKTSDTPNIWDKLSDLTKPPETQNVLIDEKVKNKYITIRKSSESTPKKPINMIDETSETNKPKKSFRSFSEKLGIAKLPMNVTEKLKHLKKSSNAISNNIKYFNNKKLNSDEDKILTYQNNDLELSDDKVLTPDKIKDRQILESIKNDIKSNSTVFKKSKILSPKTVKSTIVEAEKCVRTDSVETNMNTFLNDKLSSFDNNSIPKDKKKSRKSIEEQKTDCLIKIKEQIKDLYKVNTEKFIEEDIRLKNNLAHNKHMKAGNIINKHNNTKKKKVPTATLR